MKQITRTLKSFSDVSAICRYIQGLTDFPVQVVIKPGKEQRSMQQNRLAFQWYKDAAEQGDHTAEGYRALCKLHFGVPIMRSDSEVFQAKYDKVIRGLDYETKLSLMGEPFELPVTSLMSVKAMSQYLDRVWRHFTDKGYQLTDPAMLGIDDYEKWVKHE